MRDSLPHHRRAARGPKAIAAAILIALIAWPALTTTGRAAEAGPSTDLHTDRDAFTPSTATVPVGTLLSEGSYVFIDNRSGPDTNAYPELLCRLGSTERFEWRLGVGYVDNAGGYLVTNAEGNEGRGDSTIAYETSVLYGFKALVTEQVDWLPESCLIAEAFTSVYGEVSGTVPAITYAWGWKSEQAWRLDAALRYVYAQGRVVWFNKWQPSVVLRVPVTERWEVHAEYFSTFTDGALDNAVVPFLSPGTHYNLTKNLEVGIRVGWGLNQDAANFFSDAGFGWRY
jgi:hypothetical protein